MCWGCNCTLRKVAQATSNLLAYALTGIVLQQYVLQQYVLCGQSR